MPFFESIDALIESGFEFDVANVRTPNGLHEKQSLQALADGKHVVCEKPMGLSKDNCEKVIFKALQKNKHVFCVMQNRYSPPSEWIKSIIDEGKLGEVFMVQLNCYWNRDDRYYKKGGWKGTADLDGGTLFTQFSHFIDIMDWLFGDIDNIEFINYGLGSEKIQREIKEEIQNNCAHDYQAININTIDNLINDKIDYIKLDIEGAEQDTIKGAKNIIIKYKPILAVCIYHKAEDWDKIPQLVLAIEKDYDIYLRHYMEGIFESVMYFIPKNSDTKK